LTEELGQRHYHNPLMQMIWNLRLQWQSYYHNYTETTRYDQELGQSRYHNLLRSLARILGSEALIKITWYMLDHGAATDLILQHQCNLPPPTVRWARSEIYAMKLIEPAIRLTKEAFAKGGPRVKVWMIEGALPGQIRDAVLLHQRLQSPKYRVALQIAQTLLDQHLKEVSYREIVLKVKQMQIPFSTPDIAELTAQYLHEQGVRIWR